MATHPFMATTTPVVVAAAPTATSSTASTIGNLKPVPQELAKYIRDFLVPAEFSGNDEGAPANFRISLGDLIVSISKADLGLDNVDNVADKDKPISDAVASALSKLFGIENLPTIDQVTDLRKVLDTFYSKEVIIPLNAIEGLAQALQQKASSQHTHSQEEFLWLNDILSRFAPTQHNHSLSGLDGWAAFIQSLNNTLNTFQTVTQVDDRVKALALIKGDYEWE